MLRTDTSLSVQRFPFRAMGSACEVVLASSSDKDAQRLAQMAISEVIRIEFNPREITYPQLLEVFWQSHDPGYEVPLRQYRNAVFYLNEGQKAPNWNQRAYNSPLSSSLG